MLTALSAVLTTVFGAGVALAQGTDQPELVSKIVSAEIWACNYNDGQGPAEMDAAVDAWTEFMDANDVDDYAGWTLTKQYYGPQQNFDFLWLGAWSDGNAMGRGTDLMAREGGEIMANFYQVATCNAHVNAGSIAYKLPEGGTPANSVILFSNCSMEDGRTYSEVVEAQKAWVDILNEHGSDAAIYHWFPIYGGGDEDMDFIRLTAYPDYTAMGADYERMTNGELFRQNNELFQGLLDCDTSRVYSATMRRAAEIR